MEKHAEIEVIDEARIAKFRKDLLLLAKAPTNVTTFKQLRMVVEAARVWNRKFEYFCTVLREELVSREREEKWESIPVQPGQTRPYGGWATHYLGKFGDVWSVVSVMNRIPKEPDMSKFEEPEDLRERLITLTMQHDRVSREKAEIDIDRYLAYRIPPTRSEAEREAILKWKEEAVKWAAKLRRHALVAWAQLKELSEWSERGSGGSRKLEVSISEKRNVSLEGFQMVFKGFERSRYQDKLEPLKAGLAKYRQLAQQRAPVLLKKQCPLIIEWNFEADAGEGAARYDGGKIFVTPWSLNENILEYVHILTHEMGHHLYRAFLSHEGATDWDRFIRGDYKRLDLRDALETMRQHGVRDPADLNEIDPILALQLGTLLHHHSTKHLHLYTVKGIQEYLDAGGEPNMSVPTHPITAYAGKNTEEAFCEALGTYVAYGPRAILPEVLQMLKAVLGGAVKTASVQRVVSRFCRTGFC